MTSTRQGPQDNEERDLGQYVADLAMAVEKGTTDEVAPYDLSPLEFGLLRACMVMGECTATQLADVLPTDQSRISRIVNRLVEMGMLRRRRLTDDRRVVMLRLTDEGVELAALLDQRVRLFYDSLTEGISEEDLRAFVSTTFKIIEKYETLRESR